MKLLKLVPDNTNIAFQAVRTPAMIISLLSIIGSILLVFTNGLNFGVDFVGGQMIQATFTKDAAAPVDRLRTDMEALNLGDVTIQRFGQANEVAIRMKLPSSTADEVAAAEKQTKAVTAMLEKNYPGVRIDGVDAVSGKVSEELFQTGAYALIAAMIAISIYIWVRFEWQFGIGALFALVHDVSLTFGLFALTQMEFNLNIVAALLTIIGYSLNDTIVIYDRIRENLRKYRKMEIIPLLDLSVNETLARTVMTSLTMMMALLALVLAGPEVIFGFSAAMLFGIFVGTYSSIYMAGPILIWLNVGPDSFVPIDDDKAAKGEAGQAERITPL